MDELAKSLQDVFNQIQRRYTNLNPFLEKISQIVKGAIDENFLEQGRWDGNGTDLFAGGNKRWQPLSSLTQSMYKTKGFDLNPTLWRSGANNLRNTIQVKPEGNNAISISANKPYAALHQFGGNVQPKVTPKSRKFFWFAYFSTGNDAFKRLALTKKEKLNIRIPARPYFTLDKEDVQDIINFLSTYL